MKYTNFSLVKYEADEGHVFDWKEPRFINDDNGNEIQEHLYVNTLFIGGNDTIENYVEVVKESGEATELTTPDLATEADYLDALGELGVE